MEVFDSAIKMKNRLTSAIGIETDFTMSAMIIEVLIRIPATTYVSAS